jgi:hypothetical protein
MREIPILGTGFYRETKEGEFTEFEFLDLMYCVQNGKCSCARAKDIIMREIQARLENPPKHDWWGAGEVDCPKEIKCGNGELHTMRCKICGKDNPRSSICLG